MDTTFVDQYGRTMFRSSLFGRVSGTWGYAYTLNAVQYGGGVTFKGEGQFWTLRAVYAYLQQDETKGELTLHGWS